MFKGSDPRKLAIDLLPRSTCSVQVAAVFADDYGIFSWGWNSPGNGLGEHAEAAAIRRANNARLATSTLYVVSQRRGRAVLSKPCSACMRKIQNREVYLVWYRDQNNVWRVIDASLP